MKLDKKFFILLGAIIILQFSFFGLKYFNILDDNNQLGVFHLRSDNIYENIIVKYKSYNVRPLAFFTDAYVFSWFWDNLYALLILMILMHVCNLFFIYKICEKIDIKLNSYCLILFALAPILTEALYWISASTRIVVSLFLSFASIYILLKSFEEQNKTKKIIYIIASTILNMLCVGYYEQTIALNLFLFAFVLICLKKYKYLVIPAASTTWIGAWYLYFMMNGEMQARGAISLSAIFTNTLDSIKEVFVNIKNMYFLFEYSVTQGKEIIMNSYVSILLLAIIGIFIFFIYKNNWGKSENRGILKKVILGLIIFVVPFLPFIVLKDSFIAMRNMYLSVLGLMILIEVVVDSLLNIIKNDKAKNIIKTCLTGIAIILFVISNLDGINDYRKVNVIDDKVVGQIISEVGEEAFESKKTISLNYDVDKLYKYKNLTNYVGCVIEFDWGMAGKIQVTRQDTDFGTIYINSNQDNADYVLFLDEEMNLIKK